MVLKHILPWNGAAIAIQLLTYFSNTYTRKNNTIQKRRYSLEASAAAQDIEHEKSKGKIQNTWRSTDIAVKRYETFDKQSPHWVSNKIYLFPTRSCVNWLQLFGKSVKCLWEPEEQNSIKKNQDNITCPSREWKTPQYLKVLKSPMRKSIIVFINS